MKKIILLLILASAAKVFAQQEGTFYFMNTVSQSAYYNPAFVPKYATAVGFPGLAILADASNSGFAFRDLITRREEDDSLIMDLDNLYIKLRDRNSLKARSSVDFFHLAFKLTPRMHIAFNISGKSEMQFSYPKEIATLLINGNAPLLGKNTIIEPDGTGSIYLESGVGLNYQINDVWTIGGRLKMLNGFANIDFKKAEFAVNTAENYQIDVSGDVLLHTSGIQEQKLFSNYGYGIDLGIACKPIEKLTLGLSMIDLGKIRWTNDLKSQVLDPQSANYTFRGFDIARLIENDLGPELDSLEEKFQFQEVEGAAYSTMLAPKLYLSGIYELPRNLYAGLLIGGEKGIGAFDMAVTANITKNVGKALTLSLSYGTAKNAPNNLGAGVSFNLAPVQLYFAGDDLLDSTFSGIGKNGFRTYLDRMQCFNFRFGLNFIGGWEKTTEKLPDDNFR